MRARNMTPKRRKNQQRLHCARAQASRLVKCCRHRLQRMVWVPQMSAEQETETETEVDEEVETEEGAERWGIMRRLKVLRSAKARPTPTPDSTKLPPPTPSQSATHQPPFPRPPVRPRGLPPKANS